MEENCTVKTTKVESLQYKKNYLNVGLLKHGFLVAASRLLKEMCEVSTLSFHTGTAEGRLTETYLFPKLLAGVLYLDSLRNVLPVLLQDAHLQTRIHLWFMHDAFPPHFHLAVREFLSYVLPEQWIRQSGQTAWPARAPDLNPLIFLSPGTYEVYSLRYRTCNNNYRVDLKWLVWHLEFSSESDSCYSDVQIPALGPKMDTLGISF